MNDPDAVWALHFTLLDGREVHAEYIAGGDLVCNHESVVDKVKDLEFFHEPTSPIGIAPPWNYLPVDIDDPVSIAGAVYNTVVSMYDVEDVSYEGTQWLSPDADLTYEPNATDQWGDGPGQLVATKRLAKDWSEDDHPRGPDGRFLGGDTKEKAASESRPQSSDSAAYHESQRVMRDKLESDLSGPVGNRHVRGEVKAAIAADIAARLGSKFDEQLNISPNTLVEVDTYEHEILDSTSGMGELTDETLAQLNEQIAEATDSGAYVRATDPEWIDAVRTEAVSGLIGAWANTSNDSSTRSLAMQEAAVREFGLVGALGWDQRAAAAESTGFNINDKANIDRIVEGRQKELDDELASKGELYQAFLRAQYEATQDYFKANGITEVGVARGMTVPKDDRPQWAQTGEQDVPLRPLSSFSYDETISARFAQAERGMAPVMIAGMVPVDRVLSTARTGVGCLNEREIVVMAGPGKFDVRAP